MAFDVTVGANLLNPQVAPGLSVIKYTNTGPGSFLARMREAASRVGHSRFDLPSRRDSNYRWNYLRGTGNSSAEIFTETGAPLAAGNQVFARGTLPWVNFRVMIQVSGFAVEDIAPPATFGVEPVPVELEHGVNDLFNLVNDTLVGSTNSGVLVANDDGTNTATYAGNNRTVLTDLASALTAVGGALTIAAMRNMLEELRDNPVASVPDAIFMPVNQLTNYGNLVGPGAGTSLVRYLAPSAGAVGLDAGFQVEQLSMDGIPIYGVEVLTDTVVLFHKMSDWHVVTHRGLERKPQPLAGDVALLEQLSTRLTLVCTQGRRQGKLTGVTA